MPAFARLTCLGVLVALSACIRSGTSLPAATESGLHARGISAEADPTVRGSRALPEDVDEDGALGVEPGGGVRGIASGVRVVSMPNGAVLASEERLPQAPQITVAVPERLGGGFLFVLGGGNAGSTVWRADRWLAEAKPIYASISPIQRLVLGLDRVYLRARNGSVAAIDGRTGTRLDLGPWPGSPFVGSYAAADGWRAVAINDLRGAVATFDAGATWRPLALPIEAKDVRALGDAIAVGGIDTTTRETAWFEVRADGQVGRLGAWPTPSSSSSRDDKAESNGPPRPLGKRPLLAAVEDGWPLRDGTAVVARDGALSRVRLSDGAIVEHVPNAFPLGPSRCHPISLATAKEPGAFGFVCGEVRGPTVVYAYDPARAALVQLHRFERPRVVVGFGNGAIALRGPCDALAEEPSIPGGPTEGAAERTYCLLAREEAPRPLKVKGSIDGERIVLLADGRVAIVSPPHGDLAAARLTIFAGGKQTTRPLSFHGKNADPSAPLASDVARALRLGVWLDGFEERRPGVLGGWVDAGGSVIGLEIAVDGTTTHGPYIRDAGSPVVSGRYGLGWTASRRGFETTDGGMTWTPVEVPEPLIPLRNVAARACGPIGCVAGGWIRVGWGAPKKTQQPEPPPRAHPPSTRSPSPIEMTCEPAAAPPPPVPEPQRQPEPHVREASHTHTFVPWGTTGVVSVLGTIGGMDLPPFYVTPPPTLRQDERGVTAEASERIEHYPRTGPLARVYAWGPKTGEWEHTSRWIARWVSPFGGWQDARASVPSPSPQILLDAARFSGATGMPSTITWLLGVGDDVAHALLVARRANAGHNESTVFEVEDGRAPLELRRADGESFTDLDAAIRAGGRWYIATPPAGDWTSTVWQTDGPWVRELARIPRAGMETRPTGARLARRSDGRAVGFVVDGQPSAERAGAQRWILPIDIETGALGEPELLGLADLSDRDTVSFCTEDDVGWILDTPWTLGSRVYAGEKYAGSLMSADARIRVTPTHACIERLTGTMGALNAEQVGALMRGSEKGRLPRSGQTAPQIPVVVISASSRVTQVRYPLRCIRR